MTPLPPPSPSGPAGFFKKIGAGLSKTRESLSQGLRTLLSGKTVVTDETWDHLTELLIGSDMGVIVTDRLITALKESIKKNKSADYESLKQLLKDEIRLILAAPTKPILGNDSGRPWVTLFIGVNGVGKTTTIGKMAALLKREKKSVLLAAGDTFRAGAIDQLSIWGTRAGVEMTSALPGADPSSVAFNAAQTALAKKIDHLLVDTAGRLQTNRNLMEELKKITRVMGKVIPGAPHQTFLVLDAITGQNALAQAKQFHAGVGVSGLIITKLDTTARGGCLIPIVEALQVPVLYVSTGEGVEDLFPFQADPFIDALFEGPAAPAK
jgi:fused signal recognition particle receptor